LTASALTGWFLAHEANRSLTVAALIGAARVSKYSWGRLQPAADFSPLLQAPSPHDARAEALGRLIACPTLRIHPVRG
jgi:hypothetical protein